MDRVGLLQIPVPRPENSGGALLVDKPQAIGDPALVVLGDFVATVLNTDCQAAWETLVPTTHAPIMRGPEGMEGVGMGTVVREVHFHDPVPINPTGVNARHINTNNLPALYISRDFRSGRKERYTSDIERRTSTIKIEWVGPVNGDSVSAWERSAFPHAIASAVERAIRFGRHRAWTIPGDDEDPIAIATTTTQTSPWIVTGAQLNGPLANSVMVPARPILISTPPTLSTPYSTAPINVYGLDGNHRPWADSLSLPSTSGGRANTIWRFERVQRIEFPAMATAGQPIHVGYYASADKREGSLVARHAGFSRMQILQPGSMRPIPLGPTGEGTDGPQLGAAAGLEILIQVEEDIVIDPLDHSRPWDAITAIESRILANGGTWSVDYFTLPEPIE